MLYTPMNTGEFKKMNPSDPAGNMISVTYDMFILVGGLFIMAGHEPREDIIQLMMKRLGVQKSTLVLRDFYFNSVYCFLCSIVFTFIVWIVTLKENMGLGVFFLFVLLNQI